MGGGSHGRNGREGEKTEEEMCASLDCWSHLSIVMLTTVGTGTNADGPPHQWAIKEKKKKERKKNP